MFSSRDAISLSGRIARSLIGAARPRPAPVVPGYFNLGTATNLRKLSKPKLNVIPTLKYDRKKLLCFAYECHHPLRVGPFLLN